MSDTKKGAGGCLPSFYQDGNLQKEGYDESEKTNLFPVGGCCHASVSHSSGNGTKYW